MMKTMEQTTLDKLRKLVQYRTSFGGQGEVLSISDAVNKKILYNQKTGEFFVYKEKSNGLTRIGTPNKGGEILKTDGNKVYTEKRTSITKTTKIALRSNDGKRIFVGAGYVAAMILDPTTFDEINMKEEPKVYFKDGDRDNLKGANICWAMEDELEDQKEHIRRLVRLDQEGVYTKNKKASVSGGPEKKVLRYPIEVEDVKDFRWMIRTLNASNSSTVNVYKEPMYTKLFIQYMVLTGRWPDHTKEMKAFKK